MQTRRRHENNRAQGTLRKDIDRGERMAIMLRRNQRVRLWILTSWCAFFLCLRGSLRADDWPQWRGPDRNDISKETGLLKTWPKGGPPLLWTYKNAGQGYSGPAIVGDRLYLMGARGGSEYVYALDLKDLQDKSPRELWATKVGPTFT